MNSAYVSEIYTSLQGEGPYTGERQIFFRLAGCPFRCDYCDTPDSLTSQGHTKMSVSESSARIAALSLQDGLKTVSITGGEPLAHVSFLKELLPLLKDKGFRIYLETAGIHFNAFDQINDYCDIVAMDIKLPSAIGRAYWDEHREFLKIGKGKIFVKIVIEQQSSDEELAAAVNLIGSITPPPLLVLQPVTPQLPFVPSPPQKTKMESFFSFAKKTLPYVHIMPQQHKIWGVR